MAAVSFISSREALSLALAYSEQKWGAGTYWKAFHRTVMLVAAFPSVFTLNRQPATVVFSRKEEKLGGVVAEEKVTYYTVVRAPRVNTVTSE